ncbi:FAD/NAD(P)-binding oxidoreductase [Rhodoferax sp. GW822-FHT02A01]|uniref:FAD/NAD(P)-binding oxidoreductase n=1 Tax=Rhodoferax sp. GW822-FHT02A01 TaxID=3141537 RepID=UPI00315D6A2F
MTTQDTPTQQRCDVLIVGAGPAGLSAAKAAASNGARVLVLDDNPAPGGQIWRGGPHADLPAVATALQHAVRASANVQVLNSAKVVGILDANTLLVETNQGALHVQWNKLILCTGARERLLPFPGWTLPGVTGAGGLQALIKGGLPVQGQRVVIAGSGPLLFAVASTVRKAGAKVLMVAENAPLSRMTTFARKLPLWPSKLVQAVQLRDASYRTSSTVLSVQGQGKVQHVTIRQGNRTLTLDCDRVAVGYGLVPNTGLAQALGCKLHTADGVQAITVDTWQATNVSGVYAAGECTGTGGCERAMAQGSIAGYAAIGETAKAHAFEKDRKYWSAFAAHAHACFALDDRLKQLPQPDTLVCRCEDVSHQALQPHANWTEAKIHTRCGMGACQGKVCGTAAQFLYGWDTPQARMPFTPARIGTLASAADGSGKAA